MKTATSLKATKTESPKTPGGISKALLTPCRRVGLSRNWKKAGPSPFVSPLTTSNSTITETKIVKTETRKRKVRTPTEELDDCEEDSPKTPLENNGIVNIDESELQEKCSEISEEIVSTPLRHVEIPRRKKSKTLVSTLSKCNEIDAAKETLKKEVPSYVTVSPTSHDIEVKDLKKSNKITPDSETIQQSAEESIEQVSTPIRTKSRAKTKKALEIKSKDNKATPKSCGESEHIQTQENEDLKKFIQPGNDQYEIKKNNPNDLTKECIVVIQKKIFKTDKKKPKQAEEKENTASLQGRDKGKKIAKNKKDIDSQIVFDSDSEDLPLCQINEKVIKEAELEIINLDDEDDFQETNTAVKKLVDRNTSVTGLRPAKKKPIKTKAKKSLQSKAVEVNLDLSNSCDDDDFEMDKRTILIRKTYDKVTKPQKAKSTGSITQRDVDELKARIESKKKMLMAKAMTEDTEELRVLIKKWQKGCQDALMELMELMKDKFPEKQNMDYAEMLQTLKIPSLLVGYDEEHDCFTTPDDEGIILSKFKDF